MTGWSNPGRSASAFLCVALLTIVTSAGAQALAQTPPPAQPASPQTPAQPATPASPAQPAQQPAAPSPAAQPPAVTLDAGAGLLFHQIKADRGADFEWVMGKLKEALLKSEDPVRKQQASGISILKSADPVPDSTNVMYVVLVNPAVPNVDYSMQGLLKTLYETFPAEQQEIYKRVSGAFGGPTNRVNLQPIADFSK
jgi:hypothetical protein